MLARLTAGCFDAAMARCLRAASLLALSLRCRVIATAFRCGEQTMTSPPNGADDWPHALLMRIAGYHTRPSQQAGFSRRRFMSRCPKMPAADAAARATLPERRREGTAGDLPRLSLLAAVTLAISFEMPKSRRLSAPPRFIYRPAGLFGAGVSPDEAARPPTAVHRRAEGLLEFRRPPLRRPRGHDRSRSLSA